MSSPTLEQIEDVKGANFELDLDEPSQVRAVISFGTFNGDISTEILIEKYAKGDSDAIDSVMRRITEQFAEVLSPTGLRKLILSCRAVSKVEMEPLRQSVIQCCPKYGLILSLYQKARAPPRFLLFSTITFHTFFTRLAP